MNYFGRVYTSQVHGTQSDVGNREVSHENKAVCGKTLMNSQKLNGESTCNIHVLLNEAVSQGA